MGSIRYRMTVGRDQELFVLEQRLAQVGEQLRPDEAEALIADEFVEFGASGKVWRKAEIVEALPGWTPIARVVEDFTVRNLGESACLVTYRSDRIDPNSQQRRSTLRSSIWKRVGERWQIIFHQGTPAL
jgi:hypothetical protein